MTFRDRIIYVVTVCLGLALLSLMGWWPLVITKSHKLPLPKELMSETQCGQALLKEQNEYLAGLGKKLYGDGIHDDTEAFQLLASRPRTATMNCAAESERVVPSEADKP